MKSSMKISLFQWTQVSKLPKWNIIIDAWFKTSKVSINLNIFFYSVHLVSLLTY